MSQLPPFVENPKIVRDLLHWIAEGCQLNTAAAKVKIREKELDEWLRKGREGKDPLYVEFASQIDAALTAYEAHLTSILHEAATRSRPDLSTCRWLLERRFPKRWRSRDPGEEVVPVKADGKAYSVEELKTALEIQEAAAARAQARLEKERRGQS